MADNDEMLRDPTYEELHTGPRREKLPVDIQNMEQEETACNFCGVSYFVFAEVHELQDRIKLYSKAARFLSENARVAHHENMVLKEQVESLQAETLYQITKLKSHFVAFGHEYDRLRCEYEAEQKRISVLSHANEQSFTEQSLMQKKWQQNLLSNEKKLREEFALSNQQFDIFRLNAHEQQKRAKLELERLLLRNEDLTTLVYELQKYRVEADQTMACDQVYKKQLTDQIMIEAKATLQVKSKVEELLQERTTLLGRHQSYYRTVIELEVTIGMQQEEMRTRELLQNSTLEKERRADQEKLEAAEIRHRQTLSKENQQKKLVLQRLSVTENSVEKLSNNLHNLRSTHASDLQVVKDDHSNAITALETSHKEIVGSLLQEQDELRHELEKRSQTQTALSRKLVDHETQATEWIAQMTEMSNEIHSIDNARAMLEKEAETREKHFEQKEQALMGELKRVLAENEGMLLLQQQLQSKVATLQQRDKDLKNQLRLSVEKMNEQKEKMIQLEALSLRQAPPSVASSNQSEHCEPEQVAKLNRELQDKETEIVVLQRTVYRECLERTSLLERMRAARILPEIPGSISDLIDVSSSSNVTFLKSNEQDITIEHAENETTPNAPKASFYETLRQSSLRKSKPRRF